MPYNLVPVCEGHQAYIHSRDMWGDEDFRYLAEEWRGLLTVRAKRRPG